jgi:uncharacterized protein (TIGR02246 family)
MILALLLAAAAASAQPDCAARIAAARPAIDQANDDWIRAMKAHDAPALAAAYADDGLFILPDGSVIRGRSAVEALYAKSTASAVVTGGAIRSLGTACSAEGLVYEWGEGVLRVRGAGGEEHERGGPYLTVWKDVGGQWRIVRNLTF